MQIRHMSRRGTTNPCSRIPPFLRVSTKEEYEAVRPISEVIKVCFNGTREEESTKSGRLTALGACGRAIEYRYKSFIDS
jgi:hypothetical protein